MPHGQIAAQTDPWGVGLAKSGENPAAGSVAGGSAAAANAFPALGRPILDLRPGLDRPGVKPADTGQRLALLLKNPPAFLDSTRGPLQFKIIAVRSFFIVLVPELFPNRTRGPAPGLLQVSP